MKEVLVKKIELENYKNFSGISLPMFARSKVSGRNRVGKTTLMDGYFDTNTTCRGIRKKMGYSK